MKNIPLYDKTVSYAVEQKELEAYRASYKANMFNRAHKPLNDARNAYAAK